MWNCQLRRSNSWPEIVAVDLNVAISEALPLSGLIENMYAEVPLAMRVLSRLLTRFLYGITPNDPVTYGVAAVLVGGVALAACAIPAWRAARVDPMVALRYE